MTQQIISVNDAAPGPCTDVGMTWNESDTLSTTNSIECASLTLSGTLTGGSASNIAINTNKFTVDAASGNTLVAGTLGITGALTIGEMAASGVATFNNACEFGATDNAATSGAITIPLDTLYDGYTTNSTASIDASLADGQPGQLKIIKLVTHDTNDLVVTPTNFSDCTYLVFDQSNKKAILLFDGTNWQIVYTDATLVHV